MLFCIPVTMSFCQQQQNESVKFLYTIISSAKISECPLSQYRFICPRYLNCQPFRIKFLRELIFSPLKIVGCLQICPMISLYILLNPLKPTVT